MVFIIRRLLRCLPAWSLKHGPFMGGFHLVEPVEGNSTSPEASTGTQHAASDLVNVQSTSIPPMGREPKLMLKLLLEISQTLKRDE